MKKFPGPVFACALFCSPVLSGAPGANAQEAGSMPHVGCNANGYVLTHDPAYQRQNPDDRLAQSTVYLGVSCDAYAKTLGQGAWCWANAGVLTEFNGKTLSLARLELPECREHAAEPACGCWQAPLPGAPGN